MKPTRSLDRSVVSYTITAGAVLAVGATANAAGIIYSGPKNVQVGIGGSADLSFDLDNNSVNDFRFWLLGGSRLYLNPLVSNQAIAPGLVPARLGLGAPIGPGSVWFGGIYRTLNSTSTSHGNFNNLKGYIGVRFYDLGAGLHYGWIQFDGGAGSGTVIDWAYESNVNTPILAGATAVPEPAQAGFALALLALGAAGVRRMRQTTKTPARN